MLAVAKGKDPAAERQAERGAGTFAELAASISSSTPRSTTSPGGRPRPWSAVISAALGQAAGADHHPRRRRAVMARIDAPVLANQMLAAVSAVFTWAIREEILRRQPLQAGRAQPDPEPGARPADIRSTEVLGRVRRRRTHRRLRP